MHACFVRDDFPINYCTIPFIFPSRRKLLVAGRDAIIGGLKNVKIFCVAFASSEGAGAATTVWVSHAVRPAVVEVAVRHENADGVPAGRTRGTAGVDDGLPRYHCHSALADNFPSQFVYGSIWFQRACMFTTKQRVRMAHPGDSKYVARSRVTWPPEGAGTLQSIRMLP